MEKDFLVVSTKTGGLNADKNSLLKLSITFVKNGEVVVKKNWNVKNNIYHISPDFLKTSKINLIEHNENSIEAKDIKTNLINMITKIYLNCNKPTVMGYNIDFDLSFIYKNICPKEELKQYILNTNVDIASIARFMIDIDKLPMKEPSLHKLVEYFRLKEKNQTIWDIYKKMITLNTFKKNF